MPINSCASGVKVGLMVSLPPPAVPLLQPFRPHPTQPNLATNYRGSEFQTVTFISYYVRKGVLWCCEYTCVIWRSAVWWRFIYVLDRALSPSWQRINFGGSSFRNGDFDIYITAIGLTLGGSSAVHIYVQTTHNTENGTYTTIKKI
jgi:hypothetical protein